MCEGCYAEFRFPKIVTAATLRGAALADRVYEFSCVGGNLHIMLDDWNIDDEFFEDAEMKIWHHDASPEQIEAERTCYAALKSLPLDERVSVLALHQGYLLHNGKIADWIDEPAWLKQVEEDEAANAD